MIDDNNYFLAVALDGYSNDGLRVSAFDVVKQRLENSSWPLYMNTKNRKVISRGDVIFFYIGGQGPCGGHTVGTADVVGRTDAGRRVLRDEYAVSPVSAIIELGNIRLTEPRKLKPVLIECGIIQQENRKWGAFLMGGLCRVPEIVADKLTGRVQ
ncbi:hypothetical protein [Loktanella sp. 3ANDIMAR09]|uniref:hypothetical protein n=1 Tax=Loktanella sp. 3ANDIMAR09 TaxID=1225657 RepID=UPI0012EDEAA7|nr:hypothetical protein [Loktanella sp. 3ANDIMAR09]